MLGSDELKPWTSHSSRRHDAAPRHRGARGQRRPCAFAFHRRHASLVAAGASHLRLARRLPLTLRHELSQLAYSPPNLLGVCMTSFLIPSMCDQYLLQESAKVLFLRHVLHHAVLAPFAGRRRW
ncbi:unnamed protein product [Linum trigynum]|uniref:Uncharacterized protein n=1 Tax=Linum trigynum TaxID=586398 RepID=A0AAV2DWJ7_9ROSI